MRTVLKPWSVVADEPQPGLVDQRGRLQGVACDFIGHLACSEAAQFFIDQRQHLIGGFRVAAFNCVEQKGSLTHASRSFVASRLAKIGTIFTGIFAGIPDSAEPVGAWLDASRITA